MRIVSKIVTKSISMAWVLSNKCILVMVCWSIRVALGLASRGVLVAKVLARSIIMAMAFNWMAMRTTI